MYYFKGGLQIITKEKSTYGLYITREERNRVSNRISLPIVVAFPAGCVLSAFGFLLQIFIFGKR